MQLVGTFAAFTHGCVSLFSTHRLFSLFYFHYYGKAEVSLIFISHNAHNRINNIDNPAIACLKARLVSYITHEQT